MGLIIDGGALNLKPELLAFKPGERKQADALARLMGLVISDPDSPQDYERIMVIPTNLIVSEGAGFSPYIAFAGIDSPDRLTEITERVMQDTNGFLEAVESPFRLPATHV
jgi:hypothetical protein